MGSNQGPRQTSLNLLEPGPGGLHGVSRIDKGMFASDLVADAESLTRLFRRILAGAPMVVWAVDCEGIFVLSEGGKLMALGWDPGEMVGRSIAELDAEVPEISENTRRAMAGESFASTMELDGVVLATWHAPVSSESGETVGAVGVAIDVTGHHRVEQDLLSERQWMEEMLLAHERDRRLIGYEIHDGLVQDATGAQMHLEALVETVQIPAGRTRDEIQLALDLVRRTVREGRRLISGLRPPILDDFGVVAAIKSLIEDQPAGILSVQFTVDVQFERLEPLLEAVLYRIAQEAITNVRRHSKSDRAEISLTQLNDRIQMKIRDWGVGFDPDGIEGKRLGIEGIRERARLLRGWAVIDSSPGRGTLVFVDLPIARLLPKKPAITHDRSVE